MYRCRMFKSCKQQQPNSLSFFIYAIPSLNSISNSKFCPIWLPSRSVHHLQSKHQTTTNKPQTATALLLSVLSAGVAAAPHDLAARDGCVEYCGNTCYWQSDIDAALNKGYSLYENGQTEGSNDYPHAENNYENLPFAVSGPYQEFPILSSYQVYNGGSPGPDRVVFNTQGEFAALVTHTGASGNDFVSCQQA